MSREAMLLLIGLLVAHFLGDFSPLSTARMQMAKAEGRPIGPIAAHAAVHGALVALAVLLLSGAPAILVAAAAAVEFGTHFAIDTARARAGLRVLALRDPSRAPFWRALGIDQLAHQLVLLLVVAIVVGAGGSRP